MFQEVNNDAVEAYSHYDFREVYIWRWYDIENYIVKGNVAA